ncbi:CGNR zinc finger domain-containing protein [Micromonospora sp. NPDC050417]|uniref:CGNR zinc finger domain-containing protein n=1 Tax=Micromonospora sp. NPDC050417 TaxID=3364280 RepID=UPI00379E4E3B
MKDALPMTGEPLALDLVNTRPNGSNGPVDLLGTPDQLAAWLAAQVERLPELTPAELATVTEEDLAAVRAVREHVSAAIHAVRLDTRPPVAALRGLNDAQRAAPPIRELGWAGESITLTARRDGPLGQRLAAVFAEAAAGLLADPAAGRIRECEATECVMVFLPAHPRRRWCSPARCGNRSRVARYYQRHRPELS